MNIAMNYGVILGVVIVIVSLLFYMMGETTNKLQSWLNYVIMIAAIYIGVKHHRDNDLNGYISYGAALGTGTLIILVAAIMLGVYMFVFTKIIDPDFIQYILDKAESDMEDQGQTQKQIKIAMKYTAMMMTPFWIAIMSSIGTIFMGFIFSLITGIFLKKKDPSFDSNF